MTANNSIASQLWRQRITFRLKGKPFWTTPMNGWPIASVASRTWSGSSPTTCRWYIPQIEESEEDTKGKTLWFVYRNFWASSIRPCIVMLSGVRPAYAQEVRPSTKMNDERPWNGLFWNSNGAALEATESVIWHKFWSGWNLLDKQAVWCCIIRVNASYICALDERSSVGWSN